MVDETTPREPLPPPPPFDGKMLTDLEATAAPWKAAVALNGVWSVLDNPMMRRLPEFMAAVDAQPPLQASLREYLTTDRSSGKKKRRSATLKGAQVSN